MLSKNVIKVIPSQLLKKSTFLIRCKSFRKTQRKNLCQSLFFNKKMLSCHFCKISNNTFFTEHIWATASSCTKEIVDQDYFCFYEKSVLLIFKEHRPKKLVEATMCSTATRNCESVLKHALRRCYLPVWNTIVGETSTDFRDVPKCMLQQQLLPLLHSDFYLNLCCLTARRISRYDSH